MENYIRYSKLRQDKRYQEILDRFLKENNAEEFREDIEAKIEKYSMNSHCLVISSYIRIELESDLDLALSSLKHSKFDFNMEKFTYEEVCEMINDEVSILNDDLLELNNKIEVLSSKTNISVIDSNDWLNNISDYFGKKIIYGDYIYVGNHKDGFDEKYYEVLQVTKDGLMGSRGEIINFLEPINCYKMTVNEVDIMRISDLKAIYKGVCEKHYSYNIEPEALKRKLFPGDLIVFYDDDYYLGNKLYYGLYLGVLNGRMPIAFTGYSRNGRFGQALQGCLNFTTCLKIVSPIEKELTIKEKLTDDYLFSVYTRLKTHEGDDCA